MTGSRSSFIVCKTSPLSVPEIIKQTWERVNDRMLIFFCHFSNDASQTIPSKNRLYIVLFIVSLCCCWCADVSRLCTDILLWVLRCVWHCESFRTQGQTLIAFESICFSLSLIVVGWFSSFASSVPTEFSVIPDSSSALL